MTLRTIKMTSRRKLIDYRLIKDDRSQRKATIEKDDDVDRDQEKNLLARRERSQEISITTIRRESEIK